MQKKLYQVTSVLFMVLTVFTFSLVTTEKTDAETIIAGTKTVTKDNFDDYFGLRDATFDQNTGMITLTTGYRRNQFGSFYLKERISAAADFKLTGKVHLGNKTDKSKGGDGVGFAFYPGDVGQLGYSGNGLGIAGIKNAFGFKLDTYYNNALVADDKYTTEIGKLGYDDDWLELRDKGMVEGAAQTPFGGFLTTDDNKGYMTNDYDSNKRLLPLDDYLSTSAGDVPIEFDMTNGVLYVTLNEGDKKITWEESVKPKSSFSFHMAGATGSGTNKQTFTFDSFVFTPVKKVTVQEEWVGDEGTAARPASAGFTLIKTIDGIKQTPTDEDHYVIDDNATWSTVLDNLPELTSDQKEIFYSIEPDQIPNYESKVTSVPTMSSVSVNAINTDVPATTATTKNGETFTITNTYTGALTLKSVPENLTWKDRLIPRPGNILSRDNGNEMKLVVSDTRKEKGNWKINASVDNSDAALYSFVFKNTKDDEPVDLNGQEVLNNATATPLDDKTTYQGMWDINTGVLLRANEYIPIGSYEKKETITWNLVSTATAE